MKKRHCLLLLFTALLPATWLWSAPAGAEAAQEPTDKQQAARHFNRGLEHVDRREFTLAVTEFERAYELSRRFAVLYNLGLAYAAAGRYLDARRALNQYLNEGAKELSGERQGDVRRLIDGYEQNLARLRVFTRPKHAEIIIDGDARESSSPIEVDPGRHVISARAAGYAESTRVIEAAPGHEQAVTLELERLALSEPSKPSQPRPAAGAAAGTAAPFAPPAADQATPNRTLSYVLGGAAVVMGGAALGIRLHNDARHEEWRHREAGLPEPGSEQTTADRNARTEQDELRSSIETWDTVALGAGIAAGVSLSAAAIIWLARDSASESRDLGLRVSPTGDPPAGRILTRYFP